jgi:uncharacterized protein (TIGR03083 family)
MPFVEISQHIDALRAAGGRLADAAGAAGPDAAVPSCPEWVVRDLVRHQGGVHRWAAGIVGGPRPEAWNVDLDDVVGAWPADADLIGWFDDGLGRLAEVLSAADPGVRCWAFLPAPSPLAMWARRQAHETAVHSVDAELAAGRPVAAFPAPFAADGISELLECFVARGGRPRSETPRLLRVRCSDAPGDWLVRIGPDGAETTAADGADCADCVVTGAADDIYLALWSRRPASRLSVAGDRGVLDLFLDKVHIRWS